MHCERAQEFFSDYLERTLDRPMTVALESHLGSCASCREEVEFLQETMLALDAVPEVEPPWDGAWQVISRIRSAHAEQLEAQRPKSLTFFQWLRSLSPASMGMGAGLATLLIAGTLLAPWVSQGVTKLGFVPATTQPPVPAAAGLPAVWAAYDAERQQIDLRITPAVELTSAQIYLETGGWKRDLGGGFRLGPRTPFQVPIVIPGTGREAEAVRMTVTSPAEGKEYHYLLVVPMKQRTGEPVTLLLENRPVEEALRQLVPHLGHPVVVAGAGDASVSLNVAGDTAQHCLEEIARQSHARVSTEADAHHLTPAP